MRIVYGVGGEGNGHATRSGAGIAYLLSKGHEIDICTSNHAHEYLAALFAGQRRVRLHRIQHVPLVYENGRLMIADSIVGMSRLILRNGLRTVRTLLRLYARRKPHVVISDFEVFTANTAKLAGIPLISANNISTFSKMRVDRLSHMTVYRWWSRSAEAVVTWGAQVHVIPTFFPSTPNARNVLLTSPVVRQEVRDLSPHNSGPIVVYQTSATNTALLRTLQRVKEEFKVYGYGRRARDKNLKFCAFTKRQFLKDLAAAKAVIVGGGFSLISEAIYLKKPLLCVPLASQYEQCLNAHYVQKLDFGECIMQPTAADIRKFLRRLATYRKNLASYDFNPEEFSIAIHREAQRLQRRMAVRRVNMLCAVFWC